MAEPFRALGAGNGFPWCIPEGSPVSTDPQLILQGMTLDEVLNLYWNVKTLSVDFSVTIHWEEGVEDSPGVYSYTSHSYTWAINETWDSVHETPADTFVLPEPKGRVCPDNYRLGPDNALRDSGRIELNVELGWMINAEIQKYFWIKDGGYDYYLPTGRSIRLRNPVSPEDNSRSIAIIRPFGLIFGPVAGMPTIREIRTFSHYIGTIQDVRLETIPTRTKPFEGLSYVSHTWDSFGWNLGFHTYP